MSENGENAGKQKSILQNFHAGRVRCEIQDLLDQAEGLRQTIAIFETNWEAFNRESGEAKGELEELRIRFQELSQEVVAKDKKLEEVNLTHQVFVGELNTEIQEKTERFNTLKEEIQSLRGQYLQRVRNLEEKAGQREREVENLQTEVEQLREALTSVELDRVALSRETQKLKEDLQESRDRFEALAQELTQKDNRLEEVNQTHEALVREFKREIEEKSFRNKELEKQIRDMTSQFQVRVRSLEEQERQRDSEVQEFRDEARRLRQTVTAVELERASFNQRSSELKLQLEELASRLKRLSQELTTKGKRQDRAQNHHEEEVSSQDGTQKLLAAYKEKLKVVKSVVREESHSDSKRNEGGAKE